MSRNVFHVVSALQSMSSYYPHPLPIEVLYISPPQKSKLLTPPRKEDLSADTLPLQDLFKDADTQKTFSLPLGFPLTSIGGGGADIKWNVPLCNGPGEDSSDWKRTVLFRATLTRTITQYELVIFLVKPFTMLQSQYCLSSNKLTF